MQTHPDRFPHHHSSPATSPVALTPPRLPEKTYHGTMRPNGEAQVTVLVSTYKGEAKAGDPDSQYALPLHVEVRSHSPTGFAWGYGGSGPAQLALALLIDATGDVEAALRYYQDFKRHYVAGWRQSWTLTAGEVRAFVARQRSLDALDGGQNSEG